MNNIAAKVKTATDILEIIQKYGITLKKVGNVLQGLCPFHEEKTPSFTVYPETQSFYCFGCGQGGDVFTLVELMENISFREAFDRLASPTVSSVCGPAPVAIKIAPQTQTTNMLRKDITETILAEETAIYTDCYRLAKNLLFDDREGKDVAAYLASRGFKKEHLGLIEAGAFTPRVREQMAASYNQEMLKKTGIISYGMGTDYQLIFPQRNMPGDITGIIARLIRPVPENMKLPKYKFTPGMRKDIPFNLFNAAKDIKRTGDAIVVEGHIDALTLICAGYENVVAAGGAILNEANLEHLKKCGAKNIYLAFDMDSPGREGCKKALIKMLDSGLIPFVVEIPDKYKDINEYFTAYSQHPSFYDVIEQDFKKSVSGWKWLGSYMGKGAAGDREKNEVIEDAMKNIYPRIPRDIDKNEFLKAFSKSIKISKKILEQDYCKNKKGKAASRNNRIEPSVYLEAVNKMIVDGANLTAIMQFCNSFYSENKGFLSKESVRDFSTMKYFCAKWDFERLASFITQRLTECGRRQ